MRSRLLVLIFIQALGPACARVNADEPIALVPEALPFEFWDIGDLKDAAEDWNLDVGTQLKVETRSATSIKQRVPVYSSELLCGFWPAEVTYTGGLELHICPKATSFAIFHHELGHVLNIREHAHSRESVLSSGRAAGDLSDEDRRLFYEANPGFVGQGGCQVVRRLGRVVRPPQILEFAGRLIALLPQQDRTRLAVLNENDATSCGMDGEPGLPPPSADPLLFAGATGPALIWTELGSAFLMHIDSQSLLPTGIAALRLPGLSLTNRLQRAVEIGSATLVLLQDAQQAVAELYRADRQLPSGEAALLFRRTGVAASQLAVRGDRAVLVTVSAAGTASLSELRVDGTPTLELDLPGRTWQGKPREQAPTLTITSQNELFLISNRYLLGQGQSTERLQLLGEPIEPGSKLITVTELITADMTTADTTLSSRRVVLLKMPSEVHPMAPMQMIPIAGGVLVALTGAAPISDISETRDVYVTALRNPDLAQDPSWTRLSAPQGAWAGEGKIAAVGNKVVALWYDGLLRVDAQAKARCLTPP